LFEHLDLLHVLAGFGLKTLRVLQRVDLLADVIVEGLAEVFEGDFA
jgi:hypothetical protein